MEFRYLGFDQSGNARAYKFDAIAKAEPTRHFIVTADISLFLQHRVGLQEGPALCARKLAEDLESNAEGDHELVSDDLRRHVDNRALAEARRAEARKGVPRRQRDDSQTRSNSMSTWK
jgi:hypothetical protein